MPPTGKCRFFPCIGRCILTLQSSHYDLSFPSGPWWHMLISIPSMPSKIYTSRDRNRKMDGFFARIVLRLPDATAVIGDVVPNSAIQNSWKRASWTGFTKWCTTFWPKSRKALINCFSKFYRSPTYRCLIWENSKLLVPMAAQTSTNSTYVEVLDVDVQTFNLFSWILPARMFINMNRFKIYINICF